jgi:hypothetical protein
MTQKRFTLQDLSLADQAAALGVPANAIAKPSGYKTEKHEQQEQIWFCEWARTQRVRLRTATGDIEVLPLFDLLIASVNGAYLSGDRRRRGMQWSIMQKMGAKAGVSDLLIPVPIDGCPGMWLEMKRRRDQFRSSSDAANAVRGDQTAFLQLMKKIGFHTAVAFGWLDAARKTCAYFGWNSADCGVE